MSAEPVPVAAGDELVLTVELDGHTLQVHGTVSDIRVQGPTMITMSDRPTMVMGPPGRELL